jgi:hypothetical protein
MRRSRQDSAVRPMICWRCPNAICPSLFRSGRDSRRQEYHGADGDASQGGETRVVTGGVIVLPVVAFFGAPVILDVPGIGLRRRRPLNRHPIFKTDDEPISAASSRCPSETLATWSSGAKVAGEPDAFEPVGLLRHTGHYFDRSSQGYAPRPVRSASIRKTASGRWCP